MLSKYVYGSQVWRILNPVGYAWHVLTFVVKVIFLCYDVTDPQSFSDTEDWLGLVKKAHIDNITGQKLKLPKIYLVGNKVDLIHLRKIDQRQHDKFQKENVSWSNLNLKTVCGNRSEIH